MPGLSCIYLMVLRHICGFQLAFATPGHESTMLDLGDQKLTYINEVDEMVNYSSNKPKKLNKGSML